MEIPLTLREAGPGRLVYGIPRWYRALMAAIAAILALAYLVVPGQAPGFLGWALLALAVLAALYEDRWDFDAGKATARHRAGLVLAARSISLPFAEIELFRLAPFVRGTVPGSADEAMENAAAMAGTRGDDGERRRSLWKKPFINLVLSRADGSQYLVNTVGARRAEGMREAARRIAAHCGARLEQG